MTFDELLGKYGIRSIPSETGKTVQLWLGEVQIGYINDDVLRNQGFFGYKFRFGRAKDGMRESEESTFQSEIDRRYGAVDRSWYWPAVPKANGNRYFFIKNLDVAERIFAEAQREMGQSPGSQTREPDSGPSRSSDASTENRRSSIIQGKVQGGEFIGASFRPNPELERILAGAYRCPEFDGTCHSMRWCPEQGHVPRGFYGATGELSEVKLIMVLAEPGDPKPGESHEDEMDSVLACAGSYYREMKSQGHRNMMAILQAAFPGDDFDAIFRKVWITESVLCSAPQTTGPIDRAIERACADRFLARQLDLFPQALVAAMGGKAQNRLRRVIQREVIPCGAVYPPGCNHPSARSSWEELVRMVRSKS